MLVMTILQRISHKEDLNLTTLTIKKANKKKKNAPYEEIEDSDISNQNIKKEGTPKRIDFRRSNNYCIILLI